MLKNYSIGFQLNKIYVIYEQFIKLPYESWKNALYFYTVFLFLIHFFSFIWTTLVRRFPFKSECCKKCEKKHIVYADSKTKYH